MSTRLLPCRHVFYIRKVLHMEVVIPTQLLPSRWLLTSLQSEVPEDELPGVPFADSQVLPYKEKPWDSNRKFNEAQHVATKISEMMSEMGMLQYGAALGALQEVARRLKHGECDALFDQIVPKVADPPERPILLSVEDEDVGIDDAGGHADQSANTSETEEEEKDTVEKENTERGDGEEENVHHQEAEEDVEVPVRMVMPDQMGTELVQMGAQTVQTDTEPVPMGTVLVQTTTDPADPTTPPIQILQAVQIGGEDEDFDFESPPRSRGRPKAKPSVVKAKKSRAVAMADDDSTLHSMHLSLATVAEIVAGDPTYRSHASTLKRFNLFVFEKKTKPPVAWESSKLPASKTVIDTHDLLRVLRKDMLNKCGTKVVALQKKKPGLAERDIAVELPGFGVFSTATLAVMKGYHRAIAAVRQVEKAITWIPTVNLSVPAVRHFRAHEDPSLGDKIESLRLLSSKMEVLNLAATGCLSDDTMTTLMLKLFSSDPRRIMGSANSVSVTLNGDVAVNRDGLGALFFGASTERAMIPVNCNGNHWCAIMIDFGEGKLFYYDPMDSTYKLGIRAAAQAIKSTIPGWQSRSARVQQYTSTLGVQTDSYNCGIYVLVTFEVFSGADSPGFVDKKTLQHLRYRYLSMCMEINCLAQRLLDMERTSV